GTRQKMERNRLTEESGNQILLGMSRIRDVEQFVQARARIDSAFPERLKAGFIVEHQKYHVSGVRGDALFEILSLFASGGSVTNTRRVAAGIMILTYLFDRCEVFES